MTSEEPLQRSQQAIDDAKAAAQQAGSTIDHPDPDAAAGDDDAEEFDPRQEPPA
jgi:hypothetical protein